jgi:hypothetical protein
VKQTALPLVIQYNTTPRSSRYTSKAQEMVKNKFLSILKPTFLNFKPEEKHTEKKSVRHL